ncbi:MULTISPECIES: hypothetical protein [Bacteroides]|uniref:Zinc-ribbon domain-containing protein n=1 Tax=Bacteroides humanifaecis TaxID=2792859 RepID=A0ABV0I0Q0_9BACE|nr:MULTISPECIES: hypothetical protein [Bacteroides]UDB43407.1 hypothetical protein JXR92_013685 [Bacteroides humanifaecis]UDL11042.1 hypothetical protein LIX30_13700 [Bacteroides humanifaecis]
MEYITCKKCGCQMSAMSEACPMCGTPTNENVQTTNTSSKNETEKCEQTSNVSILKSGKRVYWGVAAVLTILFIVYVGYKVGNRQNENKKNVTGIQQTNNEQRDTFKREIPIKNTETKKKLTETDIKEAFLRHWKHYKGDRELIPLEKCSEGYNIFIGDLDGDGIDDAVVNAYVTPSAKEISDNDYEDKSYIFCFLNNGKSYKLAVATKLYTMFFVTNINNGEIHAYRIEYMKRMNDGKRTAIKDSHIFKYDGDKLVDLGGTKRLVDEENPQIERRSENAGLIEGYFYRYEGDMKGFPIKVDFGVLSNGMINGEYQNVKYGTVLDLTGQLISDKLQLVGESQNEKIVFELSFSSPEHLKGYGKVGDNSLFVNLKQISNEIINDSH